MATSMTKKQIEEINHKCSNNWKFNIVFWVYHSQKTLFKKLKIDDTGFFEFSLSYNSENQIILHIDKFNYIKDVETAICEEKGKNIILDKTPNRRRNIKKLIDITEQLTDEQLLKLNTETK